MSVGHRRLIGVAAVALGVASASALLMLGASPGLTLVPVAIGALVALVAVPFPEADVWLAFALVGTFPLLPPSPLPNLPLAAAVLVVAAVRLWRDGARVGRSAVLALIGLWLPLVIGTAISHWPAPSVWFRPASLLAIAALASAVGVLVWSDGSRRERWIDGLAAGMVVVTVTAIVVFAAQYVFPISGIVDGVVNLIGYVRGDAAAAKFTNQNNWVIYGQGGLTLRAISPLFPAPNNVGAYIGAVAPVLAAGWLATSRRSSGILRLAAVMLAVIALLLTISRSSWLGGVAALIVAASLALGRPEVRKRIVRANARRLGGAAIAIVLAGLLGAAGVASISHQGVENRLTKPLDDPSVTTRLVIDRGALTAFGSDLIRGAGLGNWESSFPVKTGRAYVHNAFLEYGLAAGVLGAMWAALLVLIPLIAGAWTVLRGAVGTATIYGLGFAAIATFTATQFLFDDNLLNPQYAWLLTLAIGGAIAVATTTPRVGRALPRDSARRVGRVTA